MHERDQRLCKNSLVSEEMRNMELVESGFDCVRELDSMKLSTKRKQAVHDKRKMDQSGRYLDTIVQTARRFQWSPHERSNHFVRARQQEIHFIVVVTTRVHID
jgi:hypothetical protein